MQPGSDNGDRDEKLHQVGWYSENIESGKHQRERVANGESRDEDEDFAPLIQLVHRTQGDDEKQVVIGLEVEDVVES